MDYVVINEVKQKLYEIDTFLFDTLCYERGLIKIYRDTKKKSKIFLEYKLDSLYIDRLNIHVINLSKIELIYNFKSKKLRLRNKKVTKALLYETLLLNAKLITFKIEE